jgi:hypothetical protein
LDPETSALNFSFAAYIISYFVIVNWTLLQVATPDRARRRTEDSNRLVASLKNENCAAM